ERIRRKERLRRHPEHSDLLVGVPQVRNLEELRFTLERRSSIAAEESGPRDAELAVPVRVQNMAAVAGHEGVRWQAPGGDPEEEVLPLLLFRRERVVQVSNRVRWIHHLENEIGEGLHLLVGELFAAPEQAGKGDVELLEASDLVETAGIRLLAELNVV